MRQSFVVASLIAGLGVTILTSIVPSALAGNTKQSTDSQSTAPAIGFTDEEYKVFVDSCTAGATKTGEGRQPLSAGQAKKACGCVADEMNKQPRSFLNEVVQASVEQRNPNANAQSTMSQIIESCSPNRPGN
jgi:hypothetical protein